MCICIWNVLITWNAAQSFPYKSKFIHNSCHIMCTMYKMLFDSDSKWKEYFTSSVPVRIGNNKTKRWCNWEQRKPIYYYWEPTVNVNRNQCDREINKEKKILNCMIAYRFEPPPICVSILIGAEFHFQPNNNINNP